MAVLLLLLAFGSGVSGCAYRVTTPGIVRDRASVFIVDYGYHSSLVLPREGSQRSEYAYGQWDWFAENKQQWYRAVPALLVPARGALGIRSVYGDDAGELSLQFPPETRLFRVVVEQDAAVRLRHKLDDLLQASKDALHSNPLSGMLFCPHPQAYSLSFHCNTATAEWLRELGCAVTGDCLVAEFSVQTAPAP